MAIPVSSPVLNDPLYICRKGYPVINVQVVRDGIFTDMEAKWPGSTSNSFVLTSFVNHFVNHQGPVAPAVRKLQLSLVLT